MEMTVKLFTFALSDRIISEGDGRIRKYEIGR